MTKTSRKRRRPRDADAADEAAKAVTSAIEDYRAKADPAYRAMAIASAKLREDLDSLRAMITANESRLDRARDVVLAAIGLAEEEGESFEDAQDIIEDTSHPSGDALTAVDDALVEFDDVLAAFKESLTEIAAVEVV